jgi:hypothetical protein
MEDEIAKIKRQRLLEPDLHFLERAYTSTIVPRLPRVMSATAKQKKRNFDQSKFKSNVLEFYSAHKIDGGMKFAYCPLTGW